MTAKQTELAKLHGKPEKFEKDVWSAYGQLFITLEEAQAGIAKYRAEWAEAGKVETPES